MATANIPRLVKHVTVSVYGKLKVADQKDRFKQAFTIARAQLAKQGFLTEGSVDGPASGIHLTGKGARQNAKHVRERSVGDKDSEFDRMFRWIDEAVQKDVKGAPPKKEVEGKVKGEMALRNRMRPFRE
jgi:hypothetical protein